jgi:glycerophosphoryl diester phosphodiesterase
MDQSDATSVGLVPNRLTDWWCEFPCAVAARHSQDSVLGSSSALVVVGHRGCGKNKTAPQGGVSEARSSIRENTITSFNLAARNGAQFVEFDVQVPKDGVPVIFHDDVIITDAALPGKYIGDLTLEQFRAIGPQTDETKVQKKLKIPFSELMV